MAPKLDQRKHEALRHRAVLLVEKGAMHIEAARAVGVHRRTVKLRLMRGIPAQRRFSA
jgi:hypothetical protein